LASFLSDDGISFTTADLAPALTLLEITGRLIRPCRYGNRAGIDMNQVRRFDRR
jgi:hypothetical protein